jgi:hypothetical protein
LPARDGELTRRQRLPLLLRDLLDRYLFVGLRRGFLGGR